MADPVPNCAITLYFYGGDPIQGIPNRFSYYGYASSPGWQVQPDGSIHPPSRSRIIQISLDGFVNIEEPVRFAGLQMVTTNFFPTPTCHWAPRSELRRLGVEVLTPDYPAGKSSTWQTLGPLTFDFSKVQSRVFYRLAVQAGDSGLIWDDPKIYDDGSQ